MRTFIALAVVCMVVSALATPLVLNEELKAKTKEIYDACAMQENLPEEEATKIRNKDYSNPTKATKCFRTCVFEKIGTLKDNKIQEAVVLEKFSPFFGEENVKKMVERCRGIKGEDRCVTGFQIYQCLENAKTELTMEA